MNADITDYIQKLADKPKQAWQVDVCNALREVVWQAIPDVTERMQYAKPHFLKNGKYAAVLSTSKTTVSFTIFNTSALDIPDGFFEDSDVAERKTVKVQEGQTLDYTLLATLVQSASQSL